MVKTSYINKIRRESCILPVIDADDDDIGVDLGDTATDDHEADDIPRPTGTEHSTAASTTATMNIFDRLNQRYGNNSSDI